MEFAFRCSLSPKHFVCVLGQVYGLIFRQELIVAGGIIPTSPFTIFSMAVFNEKQEELEHFELQMGVPRGRLAVTMDLVTDAMALVGQHGVYCQSQRWPGKPVMDVQLIMKNLTDAKELIQSVMEELRAKG